MSSPFKCPCPGCGGALPVEDPLCGTCATDQALVLQTLQDSVDTLLGFLRAYPPYYHDGQSMGDDLSGYLDDLKRLSVLRPK